MKWKIHTNNVDYKTLEQFSVIAESDVAKNQVVRGMPDAHYGSGGPIGLTMTFEGKVSPSLIGSDIGCGVSLFELSLDNKLDLSLLKEKIVQLPINKNPDLANSFVREIDAELRKATNPRDYDSNRVYESTGTLGGGNHFLEIYEGEVENSYYVSIHSGSRTFGGMVYKNYSKKVTDGSIGLKEKIDNLIKEAKKSKNKNSIKNLEKDIQTLKRSHEKPKESYLNWLEGQDLQDYMNDVVIANKIAEINRKAIADNLNKIISKMGYKSNLMNLADKPHNYIELKKQTGNNVSGIVRKGSQSGYAGELLLIPINMRDGLILAKVRDDIDDILADWNYSAPHGAGRLMSRREAKDLIDFEEFKDQMKDVVSATVSMSTLDEAPEAYKSLDMILDDMRPIIEKDYKVLKPIFNHKG